MLILLTNADQKSLEIESLIAICRQTGDKWQSKTLFVAIFDPHALIVNSVFQLPATQCEQQMTKQMTLASKIL